GSRAGSTGTDRPMRTHCPSCRARVELPDELAGTRVRCAECGRLYRAHPSGAQGHRGARFWLGVGLGVVLLTALFLELRTSRASSVAGAHLSAPDSSSPAPARPAPLAKER